MSGVPEVLRPPRRPRSRAAVSALLALGVVLLDQLAKFWALHHLAPGVVEPLLPGLLQLHRVSNSGAAFSLLSGSTLLLSLVSLVVAIGLALLLLLRPPSGLWPSLALGFLLGGTVGNGLDRWRLGAVIDFLELVPIHFPIFNLADVAINLAVLCFLIDLFADGRPQGRRDA